MEKENIFLAEEKKIGQGKGGKFLEKKIWTKSKRTTAFFGNPSLIVKDHTIGKWEHAEEYFSPFLITKLILFSDQNDQIFPLEVCKTCYSTSG